MGVTGMADREKVMRGAECCTKDVYDPFSCEECPYLGHKPTKKGCISVMLEDVIALLKEQEPRVMTKSEATSYPEKKNAFDERDKPPLYVEYKIPQPHFVKWVSVDNVYLWMNDFELNMDYGKEFRFWTSKPSEEQRKAAAWDG